MEQESLNAFTINNLWMMIAAAMVFIMNLGFATVESGLARSKNTTNILFKNTIIPALGLITYCLWGFNLMFPGDAFAGHFIGFSGFGITMPANGLSPYATGCTYWTFFLFQAMFAATAATIVSGAVAERIKVWSFMLFSVFMVGLIYPITGMWIWGGGFLKSMEIPFYDFAGSTAVHSVGGWAALAGVIVLGPRVGKYVDGRIMPIPGHSMPLATIGVFILWFGWFGFNGGSALTADPNLVSLVLVTTSLSAAAGAISSMITGYMITKTVDLSFVLNGILGGLVGITAGADLMGPTEAIVIGLISGCLVVFAILMYDKLKVDDPVGATSVHLVCGVFGTLAVGVFGRKAGAEQLVSQLIGIVSVAGVVFPLSFLIFFIIDRTVGLRVSVKEEMEGLDIGEHGMKAYSIDSDKT